MVERVSVFLPAGLGEQPCFLSDAAIRFFQETSHLLHRPLLAFVENRHRTSGFLKRLRELGLFLFEFDIFLSKQSDVVLHFPVKDKVLLVWKTFPSRGAEILAVQLGESYLRFRFYVFDKAQVVFLASWVIGLTSHPRVSNRLFLRKSRCEFRL